MKNVILGSSAIMSVVAVALFWALLKRSESPECRQKREARQGCTDSCDQTLNRKLTEHALRHRAIESGRLSATLQCDIQFDGAAAQKCIAEVNAVADAALAGIDRSDRRARAICVACKRSCEQRFPVCAEEVQGRAEVLDLGGEFEVDCIDGNNAPCFKDVLDICTELNGPCDECWRTMCGGGDWGYQSGQTLLTVKLLAATDPAKDGRVIATSVARGTQAVLPVPSEIELKGQERLFLKFEAPAGVRGPMKVAARKLN